MTDDLMPCNAFVELATDEHEGALDAATQTLFDEHLTECDGCRAFVAQYQQTVDLVGRIPAPGIDPEVVDRLLAALAHVRRDG